MKRPIHFVALVGVLASRSAMADFDSNTVTLAEANLDESLSIPVMQSSFLQDGMQSQYLFNESSVNWGKLEGLMFTQIRVLQEFGNYYHLWAGFEDGSFLGYYDKGTDPKAPDQNQYYISWQSNANHSCPQYNYTLKQWNSIINYTSPDCKLKHKYCEEPTSSNCKKYEKSCEELPYYPPPPETEHYMRSVNKKNQELPLRRFCREFFMADPSSGKRKESFKGTLYDPRKRGWYHNTKRELTMRWSNMYIDRNTNEPAFALCIPLVNLTTEQHIPVRLVDPKVGASWSPQGRRFVGVACTGMYITDMSKHLAETFTDFGDHGVYVRDADGDLVAASLASKEAYFDSAAGVRIAATASPDKLISWSANKLLAFNNGTWPEDGTTLVRWVPYNKSDSWYESTNSDLTSITKGDAFYIQTRAFKTNGLVWDVVAVQKVDCPVGYEVDTSNFVCKECIAPATSEGGSSKCNQCVYGYYFNEKRGHCKECPENAVCEGGAALPYPKKGFWMDTSKEEYLAKDAICCSREFEKGEQDCILTPNCQGGEDYFDLCFASSEHLKSCNSNNHNNETSNEKIMCAKGSSGILCDICIGPDYYDNDGVCELCSGNWVPLLGFFAAVAFLMVVAFYVFVKYGAYISANFPLIIAAVFDTGRMKVVFANMQIIGSVSWSTGVAWPPPFSWLAKVMSVFEINIFDVLPMDCAFPGYNFYGYVFTQTLVPLGLNLALFLLMESEIKARKNTVFQIRRGFSQNWNAKCFCNLCSVCKKYLGDESFVWFLILFVCYIFLPTANLALVRIFKCKKFPDGSYWLDADLSIQCTDKNGDYLPEHIAMIVYSSLMLLIYGPGIPLLFYVLLKRHHDEIINYDKEQDTMDCPDVLKPLKFLFFHYKPETYNAEWKECVRRLALVGFVALLPVSKSESALAGMILSVFWAIWDRERSPWDNPSTNALMIAFDWVVYFVFLGAFVVLSGETNSSAISWVLLFLSIGIFVMVAQQQAVDFQKNRELLALKDQIADFREQVVGICFAKRTMRGFERQRFLAGDWSMRAADIPIEMRREMIQLQKGISLSEIKDEEEHESVFKWYQDAAATGTQANWYWQEEAHKRGNYSDEELHPDADLEATGKIWVQYKAVIMAQLEIRYQQRNDPGIDPIIAVDLDGRIVGQGGDNGCLYMVDVQRLVQINAKTKYERQCLRVEKKVEINLGDSTPQVPNNEKEKTIDLVDISSFTNRDGPGTAVTLNADKLDAREITDEDMPPFPFDLIEAEEHVLLIQKGQLIQIQKKRDDGWMYGSVVWEPKDLSDARDDDRPTRLRAKKPKAKREIEEMTEMIEPIGHENMDVEFQDVEWEDFVNTKYDKEKSDEDLGGETSGWFPSIFVRPPQMAELKEMQDAMGGQEAAIDTLAPPVSWSDEAKAGTSFDAKVISLKKGREEYNMIKNEFELRLGSKKRELRSIESISRIENLALWQSYAAKKASMMCRANHEGLDHSKYEKEMMFHGTSPDVIPKIVQQGFNRGFAGRNAVRFGKGVYFALTSAYSNNYAMPDSHGVRHMFVCRVMVGETSQGYNEQLVPEVRVEATQQQYDSTTDKIDSPEPNDSNPGQYGSSVRQMYVTYHDAQAYPEYLIEYKI